MNSIRNFGIKQILIFIFILILSIAFSGCRHISNKEKKLVKISSVIFDIIIDIRYATTNNFTGKKLYCNPYCYLLSSTADKLKNVQSELTEKELFLKIYDAYRPLKVQKEMWKYLADERYIANPLYASHSRGAAVDVTLVDKNGVDLDMGTEFDEFSKKSAPGYFGFPTDILYNRILLKKVMKKHGFIQSTTEWWHFFDKDWKKYPILDLEDADLRKLEDAD